MAKRRLPSGSVWAWFGWSSFGNAGVRVGPCEGWGDPGDDHFWIGIADGRGGASGEASEGGEGAG